MISSLQWIPRGAAKKNPSRYELSAEEARMLQERGGVDLPPTEAAAEEASDEDGDGVGGDAVKSAVHKATSAAAALKELDADGLPKDLNMDTYDEDTAALSFANDFVGHDPYLQGADEDDEGSDAEDYVARPTDAYLMVAQASEDHSVLEVYCYDEKTGNLFVHHDITLPAFPLSLAWMDTVPAADRTAEVGSYVAVGTFHPSIEIWNLDVIDPLEPTAVLGGFVDNTGVSGGPAPEAASATGKKGKKGKKKSKKAADPVLKPDSHMGAVMSVSWNRAFRNLLASGSDDSTVKLWDVHTQKCVHTYRHHDQPVNCTAWHQTEGNVLASGSFDGSVVVFDASKASCKNGSVKYYDIRNAAKPLWKIDQSSEYPVSSVSFSVGVRGLLATASEDGSVRLYDVEEAARPACVGSKDMNIGKLFTVSFFSHSPWLLAAGGETDKLAIWETDVLEHLPERFGSRVLNLAEVPAAFVRPREDGQAVIAEADDDADADEDAVGGAGGDAEDPDAL